MPVQPLIQVENLSKSVGDKLLFADVSFSISEGQKVALVARNGAGKSTLLSILTHRTDYDSGKLTYRRDLRIGYLEQKPRFTPSLSVWQVMEEYISEHHDDAETMVEIEVRAKQTLSLLGINDLSQLVSQLSGGQQKRVALALVLLSEPELLILDEPTNHLDLNMVEWLEDYLRRSSHTLLMVTHDRYFLDQVCSDILEIDDQRMYAYSGNYSYYLDKRAERIEVRNAETERYRNLYRTELEWIRRMPQARAHKAQYRIDRFADIEQKAKRQIKTDNITLDVKSTYIGSKIFEAKHVSKSFVDAERTIHILNDFSYVFSRYEKLGIIGGNGTGKSTFIKLLLGLEKPDSGHFDIGTTIRFGYFSQTGLEADSGKKVIDFIRDKAEYIDLGGGKKLSASQFLQHFLFSPQQQYDYVEKLSGGELSRLYLCSVLMQNPNFLILDEPTNDLDIPTLNILEDYLAHFKGCVIVVSHDRYFMDKVVDHLFVFHGDAKVDDFAGNYTQYRAHKASLTQAPDNASSAAADDSTQRKEKPRQKEAQRRLSFKQQQELQRIEQQMPLVEKAIKEVEQQMTAPEGMTSQQIAELAMRYEQLKAELEELELSWLELDELRK